MKQIINGKNFNNINNTKIPIDINMGEIYMATNKISGKSYIGQAKCYVNCEGGFKIWGTKNRWKSHVYEAKSNHDHCIVLNSAIRKYGEDNFKVRMLIKCDINKLNYFEIEYIKIFDTILPNGYNVLKGGGQRTQTSDETREKLRNANLGKKMSILTKLYIAIDRIEKFHDKTLPRYIKKLESKNNKFMIKYPIINNEIMTYTIEKFDTILLAEDRIKELEELHNTTIKINQIKLERIVNSKIKSDKIELPKYITPIYENIYKIGYRVSNFIYCNNTIAESKDFTNANTNTRNLNNAQIYLKSLEINNANLSFQIPKLPSGFFYFKEKNRVGTLIEGFKIRNGYKENKNPNPKAKKNIPIYKKFCDMNMSLQEKYNAANNFYTLKNTQI